MRFLRPAFHSFVDHCPNFETWQATSTRRVRRLFPCVRSRSAPRLFGNSRRPRHDVTASWTVRISNRDRSGFERMPTSLDRPRRPTRRSRSEIRRAVLGPSTAVGTARVSATGRPRSRLLDGGRSARCQFAPRPFEFRRSRDRFRGPGSPSRPPAAGEPLVPRGGRRSCARSHLPAGRSTTGSTGPSAPVREGQSRRRRSRRPLAKRRRPSGEDRHRRNESRFGLDEVMDTEQTLRINGARGSPAPYPDRTDP